ncbi:MAG: sigma-70 family RNA polymerase sigma factor [Saprospiraceae bacterium]
MQLEKLILGCKAGDKSCQESLVRTYAPRLLAICRRYTKDPESASDALQETFINIFKYVDGFSGKGSFEGWMKRIAVNCSISFQKKYFSKYHKPGVLEDNSNHSEIPDVHSRMNKEDILKLLEKLPKSLYLIFNMSVVEGYSHKEISEILGITESTSRASLSRARVKLIELLEVQKRTENSRIKNINLRFSTGLNPM